MTSKQQLSARAFFFASVLGMLFVLTEMLLQSYGKSICGTAGCRLVAKQARFGDLSILLIGLGTFSLVSALSYMTTFRGRQQLGQYLDLVLIVSLACEGFFTGYQAFRLHTACVFCLIVFALLVVLGGLRLLAGRKEVLAGFAAMSGVFALFYLVLPVQSSVTLPADQKVVLFYSAECKHCKELLSEIDKNKLSVPHVLVGPYVEFLKSMGVEGVPTLFVNNGSEKIFLTGKQQILAYLLGSKGNFRKAEKPSGDFQVVLPPGQDSACKPEESCQ